MKMTVAVLLTTLTGATAFAVSQPTIKGDYLEVRSCDIYTGPCFANAEMHLAGKHAVMGWQVDRGSFNRVKLDGLGVVAVVLCCCADVVCVLAGCVLVVCRVWWSAAAPSRGTGG